MGVTHHYDVAIPDDALAMLARYAAWPRWRRWVWRTLGR